MFEEKRTIYSTLTEIQSEVLPSYNIARDDHDFWKKTVLPFDIIKGQRYGQCWCNHFNVLDVFVFYCTSSAEVEEYLNKTYVK